MTKRWILGLTYQSSTLAHYYTLLYEKSNVPKTNGEQKSNIYTCNHIKGIGNAFKSNKYIFHEYK